MRTIVVIQARLGSTRLPGKVLAPIGTRPMIGHVYARAIRAWLVEQVVLTTPLADRDAILGAIGPAIWVPHDPPDVLAGYARAASAQQADVVVRVTGDCPLLCPDQLDAAVAHRRSRGLDYYAQLDPPGCDVEVFTRAALDRAAATTPPGSEEREHVGPAIRHACRIDAWDATRGRVPGGTPWLAVDTPEDLDRVRRVHAALADPLDYTVAATLRAWDKAGRP